MLIEIKDKPVQVISIQAEPSNNDFLCWGCNVEVAIRYKINGIMQKLYVHMTQNITSHYTVSQESIFDYVTGKVDELHHVKFIEEYDSFEETKKSKFYSYFKLAKDVADELVKTEENK